MIAAAVLSAVASPAAESGTRGEYEVKGAFLVNFARLTRWPEATFQELQQPIVLGVVGEADQVDAIERSTRDSRVRDHPIEVERVSSAREAARSHVLFVTDSYADRAGEMIRATRGGGVLTVGESEEFTRSGGIINFFTRDDRIRFAINRGAAEAAGLKLSAQLLRLGKIVSTEDEVSAPADGAASSLGQ